MKKIVKSTLRQMGYEIKKIPVIPLVENPKNLLIEFLGPPGVGKTSHFREFQKHTSITFKKSNSINIPYSRINDEVIHDYHICIIKKKVMYLLIQEQSNAKFFKYINFFLDCIYNDIKSLSCEGCIINDEGIFNNFTEEFLDLANVNDNMFKNSLNNRVFISITGDPENIYERVRVKIKERKVLPALLPFNKEDILKLSRDSIIEQGKLLKIIKQNSAPHLELLIENGIESNALLINSFIKKHVEIYL